MSDLIKYSKDTFESIKKTNEYGMEYWTARELQQILEYSKWDNFVKVIDKAKEACKNSNNDISDHLADVGKMVSIGSGTERTNEFFKINNWES